MKIITNCFKPLAVLMFCFLYFLCGCTKETIVTDLGQSFKYQPKEIAPGIMLGDVYNTINFAAFTDITYYNNAWYLVFRAGTKHLGGLNGQIKILKSTDATTWTVEHIIESDTLDLRNPTFMIDTLNNKLYTQFVSPKTNQYRRNVYNFLVSYTPVEGWSSPFKITNDNTLNEQFNFWRLTYLKGKVYCAAYRSPILGGYATDNICLFNNNNDFRTYATIGKLKLGNSPNEATIRFDINDNMFFLIRRETAPVALGFSTPANYSNVKWLDDPLSTRLCSPNFLFYNNKLLICGRDQDDLQFKFFSYNRATHKLEKKFIFPSGGETGYGGMSFNPANKDELLISYYVISDEISYIKLIRMDLKTFLQ
jgi:hypothetical protein